jgi:hypothetical protein
MSRKSLYVNSWGGDFNWRTSPLSRVLPPVAWRRHPPSRRGAYADVLWKISNALFTRRFYLQKQTSIQWKPVSALRKTVFHCMETCFLGGVTSAFLPLSSRLTSEPPSSESKSMSPVPIPISNGAAAPPPPSARAPSPSGRAVAVPPPHLMACPWFQPIKGLPPGTPGTLVLSR